MEPVIFILFGATGDLAVKKIFPALQDLWKAGKFHGDSRIVAISRRHWSDKDFHDFIKRFDSYDENFLKMISYSEIDIDTSAGYESLAMDLEHIKKNLYDMPYMLYLSLAPQNHAKAITDLGRSGVLVRGGAKLLIEKPFGVDEKSAKELDALLANLIDEKQICRIDHYLGKDTVRAMMDLHENISVESLKLVRVRLFEEKGIEDRGASYDKVGAFRDVGQNHMLEMLSILAAEPKNKEGDKDFDWQKARAEALVRLSPPAKTCELSRRGQYQGYPAEKGVGLNSQTETAFEVIANFSTGRLSRVPIILESGKKMPVTEAFVEIEYNDNADLIDKIRFSVQPKAEIVTYLEDGSTEVFQVPKTMDAYAHIIFSALNGSQREFVGSQEIEALWAYADHVVACLNKVPLEIYGKDEPFLVE